MDIKLLQRLAYVIGSIMIVHLLFLKLYLYAVLWLIGTIILLWQNKTAAIEIDKINKEFNKRIGER